MTDKLLMIIIELLAILTRHLAASDIKRIVRIEKRYYMLVGDQRLEDSPGEDET